MSHSKETIEVVRAALALAQRDVDLGLVTLAEIEAIPRTRFAPVERKKIAEALSAQGASTRQIAKVTGADQKTISRDLREANASKSEANASPPEPQSNGGDVETVTTSDEEGEPYVDQADDREMKKRRALFLKAAGAALGHAQAYDGPIDSHVIKVASAVAAQWKQFVQQLREQRHHGKAQI